MARVQLRFSYTPRELWEGARFATGTSSAGQKSRPVSGWIGWPLFLGLCAGVYAIIRFHGQAAPGHSAAPGARGPARLLPWMILFGFVWLMVAWSAVRAARRNPLLRAEHTLEIDDSGVRLVSNDGDLRRPWSAFTGWSETNRLLLLRFADHAVVAIPKRSANPAQLESLRAWVRANVAPPSLP